MSIKTMNQTIADYFKTQPVVKAWLFGSFARGEETPLSDVDLLVQYEGDGISLMKHAAMICELEKLLDRPVDIVEDGTLRPRVRERVNQDRRLIFADCDWDEWEKNEVAITETTAHKTLVQTARRMKNDGMTTQQISRYTGLTAEEIEGL